MKSIKNKLRNLMMFIISFIPDVTAWQPVTKEMVDNYKAHRDPNILWADEIE